MSNQAWSCPSQCEPVAAANMPAAPAVPGRDGKVFKPIKSDLGQGWVSLKWNEATLENVDTYKYTQMVWKG